MDLEDEQRVGEWRNFAARYNAPMQEVGHSDELYQCGGGVGGFAIDPEGKMSICVLSHFELYDLRRGNFREGWDHFLRHVRGKKITRITKCTTCRIKPMCGMCPANGELENGDPEAPVDFLCHVAHLRTHALELPVPSHGDCEYCPGGADYKALMTSMESLLRHRGEQWMDFSDSNQLLPILNERQKAAGGCSSCGLLSSPVQATKIELKQKRHR